MTKLQWQSFGVKPNELRIDRTLICGQAFRWKVLADNEFAGVIGNALVSLKQTTDDVLFYFHDQVPIEEARSILADYFQTSTSLSTLYTQWMKDSNFAAKVSQMDLTGLRVMRQDPIENTFAFICSSNNNISRISGMVDSLCSEYGTFLGSLSDASNDNVLRFYSFPEIAVLAQDGVEQRLRELGFGYRAKYIAETARILQDKGGGAWLDTLRHVPYELAKKELLELSGVGPKVADCICLMSLDKAGAVPVDTHVWQIAKRDYGIVTKNKSLTEASYNKIGNVFRDVFGDYAGWAHTILFCADLSKFKKTSPAKPKPER